MLPISGVNAARPVAAAEKVPSQARRPEEESRPQRPVTDRYVPEKKGEERGERYAGNTDKVDREIERLKKKREELEQRLNRETDEVRIEALKRQLDQVERELREKDNDTYRRQHSTFTRLP